MAYTVKTVAEHIEISLNVLIDRQQRQLSEYLDRRIEGITVRGLEGLIAQAEAHLDDLSSRLEGRRQELEMEGHCMIDEITHVGRAWVLPHPERTLPQIAPMVSDPEIERIAVDFAIIKTSLRQ